MRKTPIIRLLGGSVLAAGMVMTAAPVASADPGPTVTPPTPQESAPGQLDAMQRDLGLSEKEAEQLIDEEEQARSVEKKLRKDLGDDFSGSVFDIKSGELTIKVTDSKAADTVRDAGAEAEVVEHGEDALDKVVTDLNESESTTDDGVTGWYADAEEDTVVVTVKDGASADAKELIADAGVDADAVRVEEGADTPETFADIVGGLPYYMGGGGRCSMGFAVQGGFVTAGHCGSTGTSASGQNGGSGTFAGSSFPGRDMAWVRSTSNWNPYPYVWNYRSGTDVRVSGSAEASNGSSVCRSGSTTGWHCGTVESKNQTVRYPQGTVYGLTRTSVCAEPGDSGGSFISGSQAQGVTSGGSGDCTYGGTTYFQPVNPILNQYGLSLLT